MTTNNQIAKKCRELAAFPVQTDRDKDEFINHAWVLLLENADEIDRLEAALAACRKAVLEELQEPTEQMWVAGREPILMWQAGIKAALKEAGPFSWYRDGDGDTKGDCAVWVFRAMIAAALGAHETGETR